MINFSLTQLSYIVAVDTYRNFVKAAEFVNISQPTLSMQIKKMENDLGITIFDRTKQPVQPTEIGKVIIEKAREILKQSEQINDIVQDFKGVLNGTIHIGIIPSLSGTFLPKYLPDFAEKYPDLTIHIKELYTNEIINELRKDRLDFGIVVTPVKEDKIIEKPLFYEELMVYCNKKHPFYTKKHVKQNELTCDDLWLLSDGNCFKDQVLNICATGKSNSTFKNIVYESNTLETLVRFVDKEGGYTILPQLMYETFGEKKSKKLKPIENLTPLREISLIHTRTFTKASTINAFIDHVKQTTSKELLDKERGTLIEWC